MAESNQTGNTSGKYEPANNKAVVDIANYQNPENKVSSEISAFEQVMTQMNIADRHAFEMQYEKYWQQAGDDGALLSVLICEIDFFKAYNDHYGYQGSAFMLLVISLALKNTCEKFGCYLAHYYGGEFAVLIKGGDVNAAEEIAESLRLAVLESRTENNFSKVSNVVTLSIGTSSIYPTSMKALIKQSTNALNRAKKTGHNQVCSSVELKNEKSGSATTPLAINEPEQSDFQRLISEVQICDHRDFNRYFVNVWQESTREKELLSMIICELDFFKEYSQHYSQKNSEEILLLVACTLKSKCEEFGCFIARLEGQKFVALVKGGNATKGLKIAKALHDSIQALTIEHAHSPVNDRLTMSLGLSSIFPSDDNTMKSLMSKVDTALRDAKSSGYDQIKVN
ncbi:hypothetical protein GCM10007916_32850 [Psychromonas marina]|uniref:diguanylate cyclase n=1 Tax=Psychromonas marina TaxID=88364 RepID=A0ABQ6E4H9_9GAMM|nr:diguanylate cyclase [Psychromonas marina]GLS92215.1 hypothetical protein GCM10007916_32850 [Psychromonas marina]